MSRTPGDKKSNYMLLSSVQKQLINYVVTEVQFVKYRTLWTLLDVSFIGKLLEAGNFTGIAKIQNAHKN